MAGRVKTWVWVVVGVAALCILGLIAMAGAGLYYFSRHVKTVSSTPADAAASFDEVKARFQGQAPLIELDDAGNFLRSNADRQPPASPRPLQAVHVLVFDTDDGHLVRATMPFWALRLMSGGNASIKVEGRELHLDEMRLTPEDLERFGPTLIVDHRSSTGDRILVWSQ